MRSIRITYNIFCGMLLLCFAITSAFAQNTVDSILKKANYDVYENPLKAIDDGLAIYNDPKNSIEQKIDALLLISTAYSSIRSYEKSLEYASLALDLLPSVKSETFKIKVYNKIGTQYQQLKIYDKALRYLDNAMQIASSQKDVDSITQHLGYNYAARGFIYREQMSCDIALNFFNRALYHYKRTLSNPLMNANLSIIEYNKGNCFITLQQIDSSKMSFSRSISFAKTIEANSLLAFAYKGLAEVYTLEGDYQKAITQLNEALALAESVGDLILNQGIYKGLSDNYLATDNKIQYQHFSEKYHATQRQIKKTESKTINQTIIQTQEAATKKIEQINRKFNIYKIILFITGGLTLIGMFLEYFSYKKHLRKLFLERRALKK